jgi:hypothetical protein
MAVWSLRVGYVGLAVAIAGLVVSLAGGTPRILSSGSPSSSLRLWDFPERDGDLVRASGWSGPLGRRPGVDGVVDEHEPH